MANHKVRNIILLCVAGHIALSLSAIGLVLLSLRWPSRREPTLKYYSNDANYVPATGLIKESAQDEEYYRLTFEWARDESGFEIPRISFDGPFVVWLPGPMKAAEMCDPLIGKEISFVCCNGGIYRLPIPDSIVQISYAGSEILAYEDGKSALLRYVSSIWN